MRLDYSDRALRSLAKLSPAVERSFYKQARLLEQNLRHPSLHAKKYDEANNIWQARVNRGWRFYFSIVNDTYYILDIIPHPK